MKSATLVLSTTCLILFGLMSGGAAPAADAAATAPASRPIALHPDNPHYFVFRGKPTILIGSTEHYGAVLNLDFDYVRYLDELAARGLNLTRVFSGTYRELPGDFGITGNVLAPAKGRFAAPWARSDQPGYFHGGNKFDLTRFDDAYFARLRDFVAKAAERGVVVEYVLFCPLYEDPMWNASPMKAANNVNGIGDVPRKEAHTLKHKELQAVQEAFVRKAAAELREFDNVFYEVCNEPYFGGVTIEWQHRIIDVLTDAEKGFPAPHLIAQNIANHTARVKDPHPKVSIFNFHYARPPTAVKENYHLGRVIGDDETGFDGSADDTYRREAWHFILAGGGLFDHLDYSFNVEHPDGTAKVKAPGGGSPALRGQFKILKDFVHALDFIRMRPMPEIVLGGVPDKGAVHVLATPGKAYALYLTGGAQATLTLDLPAGKYRAEWVNPRTGEVDKSEGLDHVGNKVELASPPYAEDVALRILGR